MSKLLLAMLTVGVAILVGACEPEIPAMPTFEKDVKPIFMAQCVRCHGAGDMLRVDPAIGRKPAICFLDELDDIGPGCTSAPPNEATCRRGVFHPFCMTALRQTYFPANKPKRTDVFRMPPPPSEVLTDWEHEVIVRWLASPVP